HAPTTLSNPRSPPSPPPTSSALDESATVVSPTTNSRPLARAAPPEKGVVRPAAAPGPPPDREGSNRVRTLNHGPRASGVDRRGCRAHPRRGDADTARDQRLHRLFHAGRPPQRTRA